jgi:hypothetical protein
MQYFGIWSVFTWKTIPPPQLYKSKVKVKMAATYSEEKKDRDLVDFLFCCSSKRCDCVQKEWNSEQLASEYVCMHVWSVYLLRVVTSHMPNQSAFSALISNSSLRTSVSLTRARAVVWGDLAITMVVLILWLLHQTRNKCLLRVSQFPDQVIHLCPKYEVAILGEVKCCLDGNAIS